MQIKQDHGPKSVTALTSLVQQSNHFLNLGPIPPVGTGPRKRVHINRENLFRKSEYM